MQYLKDSEQPGAELGDDCEFPERELLWLPSSIVQTRREGVCMEGLPNREDRYREAQLADGLNGVCHVLRIKSRMMHFQHGNMGGQREGNRSRTVIDRVHERALSFAVKYRRARSARVQLVGAGSWEEKWRELTNADIRSYVDVEKKKPGPGRRGTNEEGEDEVRGEGEQIEEERMDEGVTIESMVGREDDAAEDGEVDLLADY